MCGFTATVITDGELSFKKGAKGTVSVFALSEAVRNVDLKGLLYPLENATIESGFPLGVSNEFTGEKALIKIGRGTALVIWQGGTELLTV